MTSKKVWVLLREYNAYNQCGAYFVALWLEKPTHEQLIDATKDTIHKSSVAELLKYILFLEKGGGREDTEDEWFLLEQVTPGELYNDH